MLFSIKSVNTFSQFLPCKQLVIKFATRSPNGYSPSWKFGYTIYIMLTYYSKHVILHDFIG